MENELKEKIKVLVDKYEKAKAAGELKSYTEEDTKNGFIIPLFKILGWDFSDRAEVSAEESMSAGRVDYGFYFGDRPQFYLEAKPVRADLSKEEYANQAIRYSWNKGATWAVLTNFENLIVFNAQDIEKPLEDKIFFNLNCSKYLENIEQLYLLSKESFQNDLIGKEAEKWGKKIQKVSVTSVLYKDLQKCRELLVKDLKTCNGKVDNDLIDEGVQKLLDRLIFIRVAEDRGIEPPTLIPMTRESYLKNSQARLYETMVGKFRELDEIYNSNLFSPHPFEQWEEFSGVTDKVIKILYGKKGYYEYDFKVMPADVLGTVYENYLAYKLSRSKSKGSMAQDAGKRKEQGIYYTPRFIVDYIVKNALGPILDECTSIAALAKIKVLDPACGSGSFLIRAFEMIKNKYAEFGMRYSEALGVKILTENIYGVDLDIQAVEIARLNLLIGALSERMKLPKLENIKNGNSLISGTDEELKQYFGKDFADKKPFNWQEQYPEVFAQGGFDCIIGNPPYINAKNGNFSEEEKVFYNKNYETASYQLDSYILFIESSIKILKENGFLGFIIPNSWLSNIFFVKIRKFLLSNTRIKEIIESQDKVFGSANVDTVAIVLEKDRSNENNFIKKGIFSGINYEEKLLVNQSDFKTIDCVFSLNLDNSSNKIIEKIEKNSYKISELLDISTGIKEYQVGKGVPSQKQKDKDELKFNAKERKDESFMPELRGKNIGRYDLRWNEEYVSYGKWLAEPRKPQYFNGERILMRKIPGKNTLIVSYTDEAYIIDQSLYVGKANNPEIKLKFILPILNSKLIGWYFKNKYNEFDDLFPQIKIGHFKSLPIRKINFLDESAKAGYDDFVALAEKMIDLYKKLRGVTENSNEWQGVKAEIEKTDAKIDAEVYKLYGITSDEIKIIEAQI